jgi:hypothetical protein
MIAPALWFVVWFQCHVICNSGRPSGTGAVDGVAPRAKLLAFLFTNISC